MGHFHHSYVKLPEGISLEPWSTFQDCLGIGLGIPLNDHWLNIGCGWSANQLMGKGNPWEVQKGAWLHGHRNLCPKIPGTSRVFLRFRIYRSRTHAHCKQATSTHWDVPPNTIHRLTPAFSATQFHLQMALEPSLAKNRFVGKYGNPNSKGRIILFLTQRVFLLIWGIRVAALTNQLIDPSEAMVVGQQPAVVPLVHLLESMEGNCLPQFFLASHEVTRFFQEMG